MLRYAIYVVLIIASAGIGLWLYGWYQGKYAPSVSDTSNTEVGEAVAYFAGGCFWCVESDFEKLSEVTDVISGYMGGKRDNPSYKEVASGATTHREMVKVIYNPNKITYRELVLHLLRHTDPTDSEGSFYDRGRQYASAIYYQNEEERQVAEAVIQELEELKVFNEPIATRLEPAGTFWIAEEYHQDYYKKSSLQYKYYRAASGRDDFIEQVWGDGEYDNLFDRSAAGGVDKAKQKPWRDFVKPDEETLRQMLTPIQYHVTQEEGTEQPFQNAYWDNHEEGIYVDIVSGEPLFSSTDKFDSGTGWPSFLKPIDPSFVTEHTDYKLILPRTEIRSRYADSHLGHIILDGPAENDKIRYCMNSAALRFVPKEQLAEEGLGEYLYLFE